MKELVCLKLKEIAHCIYKEIESNPEIRPPGLFDGDAGILLFLFYYSHYSKDEKFDLLTDHLTDQLLERFSDYTHLYTFCDGISGILYVLEILKENDFVEIDLADSQTSLDKHLYLCMQHEMTKQNYDFIHGALGIALYFLKNKRNHLYAEAFIDYLYETAEKEEQSNIFKWKSRLGLHDGIGYNIALSHGISSIIVFLSHFLSYYPSHPKATEMLIGSVNYVLEQELDFAEYGSHFPSYSKENSQFGVAKSRLAWCYGDLGIGIALWQAGKALPNEIWKNKALTILLDSTTRQSLTETLIIDAGICHGSVGLAMIFNRMYKETNLEQFQHATAYWLQQTVELAKFKDGLAGYKTYNGETWDNDYSLLTGIAGIGLTFLSYVENDPQNWDEILLLS